MEFKYTNGLNKKAVFSLLLSDYYSYADNDGLYHPTLTSPLEIDSTDSVELNYYLGAIPVLNTPRVLLDDVEYKLVTILLVYAAEHSSGYIYAIAEIIDNGARRYCPISKKVIRIEEDGVTKYANRLGIVASSSWQDRYLGLFTSISEVKQSLASLTRSQINGYLLEGDASSIYSLTHTTIYESDGLIGLSVPSEIYNKWYRFNQLGIEDIGGKTPRSDRPGWGSAFLTEFRKFWLYSVRLSKNSSQTIGSVAVRDLVTPDTMIDYPYKPINDIESIKDVLSQFGYDTLIGDDVDYAHISKSVDLVSHEDGSQGNTPSWLGEKHFIINEEQGGSVDDLTLMVSDYTSRESFDTLYLYDLFSYVNGTLTTPFKTISLIPHSDEETILQRNIIISKVIVLPLIVKINNTPTVVTNNVLITAVGVVDLSSGTVSPLDSLEEEDYDNQDWEVKLIDTDGNDYSLNRARTYSLQDWTTELEIIAGNKNFPISRLFLSLDLVSSQQEFDAMVELCYGTTVSDAYAGLLYYNRDRHVSTNLYKKEGNLQSPLYIILNSHNIMAAKFMADNNYEFNMGIISDQLKVGNNYWNILSNAYEDQGFTNDRRSLLCINTPEGEAQSFSILTVKNERKVVRTLGEDNRRKNTIVITVIDNNLPIPTVQNATYSLEYSSEGESIEENVPYTTVVSTVRTDTLSPISYLNTLLTGQILFNSVIPGTLSYELSAPLDWFRIQSITDGSDVQTVNFVIEFQPNNVKARLLDITFKYTSDGVIYDLYKVSIPLSLNPERYNPEYDDIKKYWSSGETFTLIDTNEGADYSSTSLLYKNNHTNIYETLAQKDNTLFLGNYKSTEQEVALYKRLEEVEQLVLLDLLFTVSEELLDYQLSNQDEDWYGYTPDLTLNSAEKRIFKKGETYNIGISFLHKTGYWSTVFIPTVLPTWNPSNEPSIVQKDDNLWYLRKPVLKVNLNKEAVDAMTSLGFIGAIPVRVEKQNHSILALGIAQKALTNEHRKENDYVDYMYPWSSKLTGLSGEKEAKSIIPWYGEYSPVTWGKADKVFVLNSPEVESNDYLLQYTLEDSYIRGISTQLIKCNKASGNIFTYGSLYLHSKIVLENLKREPYVDDTANTLYLYGGPFFHGFLDLRYGREGGDYTAADLDRQEAYSDIMLFYWNRERLSGENSTLKKSLINYLVLEEVRKNIGIDTPTLQAKIFRDFDSVLSKTIKVDGKNKIYQANTDLIVTYDVDHPYANISYGGWWHWVNNRGSIDYVYGRTSDFWGRLYHEDSHINSDHPLYRPWGVGSKPIDGDGGGPIYGIGENGHVNDPINIRYKSAPHIFFSAEISSGAFIDSPLALCEIYKNESTDFTDVNYLQNQVWIKCGEMRRLKEEKNLNLLYEEGDYFYGRFDSLRVEPFALGNAGDTNLNAEVVSFLCSSRINLDARTDSFRGVALPIMNHTNFNRFNHVYDLSNNYFTFAYIDYKDSASADPLKVSIYERLFRSSILWSMTKQYGEEIDSWLNIQDVNTLDLDGDKGSLTALVKLNNNILAFLETGIALVLYNEKTLVSVTEGVPVEIANSGKVDGKAYFSSNIGCLNKFSIAEGLRGLYFIDTINKTIYLFDGNKGLIDICATYHMKSWGLNNLSKDWWAYYDKRSQEVLFMSKNDCIVFSDKDAIFNCFLSYIDVRWHFYMNDYIYAWKLPTKVTLVTSFWKKNSLNKTSFFGKPLSLYLQIVANPEPLLDKTFTNIEYRADVFSKNAYLPNLTFTTVLAEDEFLNTGEVTLDSVNNRKKFRVWRIDIPRDTLTPQDRIRNPWCKIKLGYTWPVGTEADRLLFYDAVVSYLL